MKKASNQKTNIVVKSYENLKNLKISATSALFT